MYVLERLQKVQDSAPRLIFQCRKQNHIKTRLEYNLSVICHSFRLGLSPTYLSDRDTVDTPKEIYTLLLTIEFYASINCEQGHLGIAHFLSQLPKYGNLFLQNSDILILSKKFIQNKKLIFLGDSIHDTLNVVDLDVKNNIRSTNTCVRLCDCKILTCDFVCDCFALIACNYVCERECD